MLGSLGCSTRGNLRALTRSWGRTSMRGKFWRRSSRTSKLWRINVIVTKTPRTSTSSGWSWHWNPSGTSGISSSLWSRTTGWNRTPSRSMMRRWNQHSIWRRVRTMTAPRFSWVRKSTKPKSWLSGKSTTPSSSRWCWRAPSITSRVRGLVSTSSDLPQGVRITWRSHGSSLRVSSYTSRSRRSTGRITTNPNWYSERMNSNHSMRSMRGTLCPATIIWRRLRTTPNSPMRVLSRWRSVYEKKKKRYQTKYIILKGYINSSVWILCEWESPTIPCASVRSQGPCWEGIHQSQTRRSIVSWSSVEHPQGPHYLVQVELPIDWV